jgi:hypothetical protein
MENLGRNLRNWKLVSLVAAVVGVTVCAGLAWNDPDRLWPAYLLGFLACWLVCMGGMGLLALGNLTGGRWALVARPFYLAANQLVPILAVSFVPIGLFTERIYPWASATPGSDVAHAVKAGYLDTVFFCERAAAYSVVWLILSWLLSAVSRPGVPPASTPAMRRIGAVTLVLLVPTATFAAFDWGMSLEPTWYSSIYGALLLAGGVLAAHGLAICGLTTLGRDRAQEDESADIFNDLGNLLLAFLMVNAYFAFSQFLIIWSGNLPSEIPWYLRRLSGGWQWLALSIVALHFGLPFLMLLSRDQKRAPRQLRHIAVLLVIMYLANLYWMIVPAFASHDARGHAIHVAGMIAMFGVCLALFCWRAERVLTNRATVEI